MKTYTREKLDKIYSILVDYCGADSREHEKEYFISEHLKDDYPTELRILSGFGGKFKRSFDRIWVYTYQETITPKIQETIDKVNLLLKNI